MTTKRFIIICALLLLTTFGCEQKRVPDEYRVPKAYRGWLIVVFGQRESKPLLETGGFRVYDFPASGVIITSSKPQFGWASDRTMLVSEDGGLTPLGPSSAIGNQFGATGASTTPDGTVEYLYFFFGSKGEFDTAQPIDKKLDEVFESLHNP